MDYINWRLPYVVFAILAWVSYIIYKHKQEKNILKYWGFRFDNFKEALKLMLPFGVFVSIGFYQKTIHITWHILPILITYPIMGKYSAIFSDSSNSWKFKGLKAQEVK